MLDEKMKEYQTIYYRIVRRTSKYNKYIKWFIECYRDKEGKSLLSSAGYRTQKEARGHAKQSRPLPVGNRLLYTNYQEI